MSIKVLVVEDEPVSQQRFCDAIRRHPDLSLCGSATTVAQACAMVDALSPDVVLVDLGLPDGSGVEVIRHAQAGSVACDVLVVTMFCDDASVIDSICAGATGYLLKDALPADIASAVRQVHFGESPISPAVARRVLQCFRAAGQGSASATAAVATEHEAAPLSEREQEILRLVAKGLSFKDVGTVLSISSHTVITHVKRIYQKLAVHSRGEAVYEASQMGLL